jgi:hypothetical protein
VSAFVGNHGVGVTDPLIQSDDLNSLNSPVWDFRCLNLIARVPGICIRY